MSTESFLRSPNVSSLVGVRRGVSGIHLVELAQHEDCRRIIWTATTFMEQLCARIERFRLPARYRDWVAASVTMTFNVEPEPHQTDHETLPSMN